MNTKRIWRRDVEERRGGRRVAADFYAIELDGGARYLRRVTNVSADGLLLENPLADGRPGQIVSSWRSPSVAAKTTTRDSGRTPKETARFVFRPRSYT